MGERVVMVTGAASGIGKASAMSFADQGDRVVVADVDCEGGEAVAEAIGRRGGQAIFESVDVSCADSVGEAVDQVNERWGGVDVLYNNAATTVLCNEHDRPVHELQEWVWDKMHAVTLKGVFLCCRAVLPGMMRRRRGVIINTTSVAAQLAEPGCDAYVAAKGAIISLTRSMATEYAAFGVRVNAISPGLVITECQRPWYDHDTAARARADDLHLTRIGRPEDIAEMALYLASSRAEFITGAVMNVDGGFTAYRYKDNEYFYRTGDEASVDADSK